MCVKEVMVSLEGNRNVLLVLKLNSIMSSTPPIGEDLNTRKTPHSWDLRRICLRIANLSFEFLTFRAIRLLFSVPPQWIWTTCRRGSWCWQTV